MMKRKLFLVAILLSVLLSTVYILGEDIFYRMLDMPEIEQYVKNEDTVQVIGKIYQKEKNDENYTLYLKNIWIQGGTKSYTAGGRLVVYISDQFNIGQYVQVSGTIQLFQESPNPGNFNQKEYYQKQKIAAAIYGEQSRSVGGKTDVVKENLWKFKTYLAKRLVEVMGEREGTVLCSILLGESGNMEVDVKEGYQKSGAGHLLAISGLHISFLGMGLYNLMKKCGVQVYVSAVIASLLLYFYVQMTGASVSSLRALFMFWIRMLAIILGREYDGLTAISVAALVLIIDNPLRLFCADFQLSFCSVLSVYLVAPCLKWESLRVPLAINLTLLPLLLYYYYELCLYSIIWNLIIIPLSGTILATGGVGSIFLCIGTKGDLIAKIILLLPKCILKFYDWGNQIVLSFPFARVVIGRPTELQIIIYYIALYLFVSKDKLKILYLLIMGNIFVSMSWFPGKIKISMLDVGQGDSIYIRGPSGNTYLMDGGSSSEESIGRYRLEPFLKSQGVGALDYVFITHGDEDHLNGIQEMLERQKLGVRIKYIVLPPERYWEENIKKLVKTARKEGVSIYTVKMNDCLSEKGMSLTCIWPEDENGEASNENSLVFHLSYGTFDMLFTGDLELQGEERVVEKLKREAIDYEVLKVGHHGSKNSSSPELLETIKPELAIISCGQRNSYGHPHKEVLQRLEGIGCKTRVTAWENCIEIHLQKSR